jgi:thiosulfate/3-mercaptopyruvate sulfurtransferase
LEVWQKVFLKDADFMQSTHGKVGCVICHGGDSSLEEKELAHVGLVIDPSELDCNTCHQDIAHANALSLHSTLSGFESVLEARGGDLEEGSPLSTAFENHCDECHTSCGQCHVSRPDQSGGGLVSSHEFRETPSMQYNCTACHGSRVGDEYLGGNEGVPADVHWTELTMTCTACHSEELHGSGESLDSRYENPDMVKCEDCHLSVWTYKNCYNCHVAVDEKGLPCRTSDPIVMDFKIGYNPLRSSERSYEYVVLRHVPTCTGTCDYYGTNLLPDFDSLSTWKYATPHNIQLNTPQNASCNACHGNTGLFLTEEDVNPEEAEANKGVIVNDIPNPQTE